MQSKYVVDASRGYLRLTWWLKISIIFSYCLPLPAGAGGHQFDSEICGLNVPRELMRLYEVDSLMVKWYNFKMSID